MQSDFTSHTSSCVPPPPGAPAHQAHSHQEIRSSRFPILEWSAFAPGLCVAGSSSSLRWLFTHYLLWETFLIILSRLDLACSSPRRLHHCPRSFFFSYCKFQPLCLESVFLFFSDSFSLLEISIPHLSMWKFNSTYTRSLDTVLEKAMAPHSSTLAWKIPWTEEPGRLQSMGSLRVRHD